MSLVSKLGPATSVAGLIGKIKIKAKVMLGFAMLLVILAAVSGVGYVDFVKVGHEVDLYAESVEEASVASRIETEFLRLAAHALKFTKSGHEEDVTFVHEVAKEIRTEIEHGMKLVLEPEHREKMEQISKDFEIYMKDFEETVVLKRDHDRLIEEVLEPAAQKFDLDLDKMREEAVRLGNNEAAASVGIVREQMLLARLYANVQIDRDVAASGEKTLKQFKEIKLALEALGGKLNTGEERRLFAELNELLEEYESGFKKVHQEELEIERLINGEMKEVADEIIEDGEWLKKSAADAEIKIRGETAALIGEAEFLMLTIGVAGLVVGMVLAWLLGNGIARPVISMTVAMRDLADGNKEVEIPAQGRADEIGEMAQAVQVFKENMIKAEQLAAEAAKEQAAKMEEAERIMGLCEEFDKTASSALESVASAATEMQSTSEGMSSTAQQTNQQATTVAAASEEASVNVQAVASATEEMSTTVSEIGRQVEQSSLIAKRAVAEAEKTNVTVQGMAEAAEKIGAVVELITGIAEQTNLLALNATIEAARAGDAGKGFAVVASEVKSLANQTAKATEEIGAQIAGMQSATGEAVDAIGGIGKTIAEVDEIATAIAAAVEEQGTATQEIARNVQEAAKGTQDVSSNIGGVSEGAEETGKAANQVLEVAGDLSRHSEGLREAVDKFLTDIRAA